MSRLKVIQNGEEKILEFTGSVLLREILTRNGYFVPQPCGGKGKCGKCRVTVNGKEERSCSYVLTGDATVLLPDREVIFSVTGGDESGKRTKNVCLCLDIGTTTLALALVSLDEKCIIRTLTVPNPQRTFGADVISRIEYCTKNGVGELQAVLLQRIGEMVGQLLDRFSLDAVERMYVAGNTTMLHLLFGADCTALGVSPYTPAFLESRRADLGIPGVGEVISLPGISAFVGADIVAGIHYVGAPAKGGCRLLLDLGTNAEIALFDGKKILCTSAAAGPCFEGANISCGMSAGEGAVCACSISGGYTVIGGGTAKGICATGLIDVIADGLRREWIDDTGCLEDDTLPVCHGLSLTKQDIREFQLAKAAIRGAIECLLYRAGIGFADVEGFYVAGGFSAGINAKNAAFVGLFPKELAGKFYGINNASLLGTVKFACAGDTPALPDAEYVDLAADTRFAELFVKYMAF